MPDEELKRTSIDLPLALWRKFKVQAVTENRDFRELVIEALNDYLAAKAKKGRKA